MSPFVFDGKSFVVGGVLVGLVVFLFLREGHQSLSVRYGELTVLVGALAQQVEHKP